MGKGPLRIKAGISDLFRVEQQILLAPPNKLNRRRRRGDRLTSTTSEVGTFRHPNRPTDDAIPRGLHLRQRVLAGVAIAESEGSVGKVLDF